MLFFLLGGVCIVAFFKVLRRGTCRGRGGPFWRRGLHRAFARLDTSPGQEKEIRGAVEDFLDDVIPARREMGRHLRGELVEILDEDELDLDELRARFSEQEARMGALRESLLALITRVHAALDGEQRDQLARWMKRGRARHVMGGPYR